MNIIFKNVILLGFCILLIFVLMVNELESAPNWWDTNYLYRMRITVTNNTVSTLSSGYPISFTMDTRTSATNVALTSGNDVRIIYWNETTNAELDRVSSSGFNSSSSLIWFKTQASISGSGNSGDAYWVYYGNASAGSPPTNTANIYSFSATNFVLNQNSWTSASSIYSGYYAYYLVDGIFGDGWVSVESNTDHWAAINFQSVKKLGYVSINLSNNYQNTTEILVQSWNGSSWVNEYDDTTPPINVFEDYIIWKDTQQIRVFRQAGWSTGSRSSLFCIAEIRVYERTYVTPEPTSTLGAEDGLPSVLSINPNIGINSSSIAISSITGNNFKLGWDVEPNLIGNWRLESATGSTVSDLSGNGNSGTLTNSPNFLTGKIGNCLNFNGSNQYVEVADAPVLRIGGNFSVMAWFNADAFTNDIEAVVSRATTGGFGIEKLGGNNKLAYWVGDGTDYQYSATSTITTGTWYHVVGTSDGTNIRVYTNATLTGTTAQSNPQAVNTTLRIGLHGSLPDAARYWDGKIDEVRLYNRVLSAIEIFQIYNATGTGSVKLVRGGSEIICTGFTYTNSSTLSNGVCDISGATPGDWDVVITNPDGTTATLNSGFTIISPTTVDVNWNNGNVQTVELQGDAQFTFSNGQAGAKYTLILKQDDEGGRKVYWSSSIKWVGSAPTLSTIPGKKDVITFIYDGDEYLGDYKIGY